MIKHEFNFLTHYWGPPKTGGEKYNFTLINGLTENGYKVNILSDEKIPEWINKNYVFYVLYYIIKLNKFKDRMLIVDSRNHIKIFVILFIARMCYNPYVIGTVHHLTCDIRNDRIFKFIDRIIESNFIKMMNIVFVPSHYTRMKVMEFLPKRNRVFIVNPGIYKAKQSLPRKYSQVNTKNLLYVGTVEARKGIYYLIKALAFLNDPDLFLNIIGSTGKDPKYAKILSEMISDFKLYSNVHMRDFVDQSELDEYYEKSDIFIFPTLYEGFGIVVQEAMSAGLPIITTNVTTMPEIIIHGKNGYLVRPKDSKQLAHTIKQLIQSPESCEEMSRHNISQAKSFNSWDDVKINTFQIIYKHISELKS